MAQINVRKISACIRCGWLNWELRRPVAEYLLATTPRPILDTVAIRVAVNWRNTKLPNACGPRNFDTIIPDPINVPRDTIWDAVTTVVSRITPCTPDRIIRRKMFVGPIKTQPQSYCGLIASKYICSLAGRQTPKLIFIRSNLCVNFDKLSLVATTLLS